MQNVPGKLLELMMGCLECWTVIICLDLEVEISFIISIMCLSASFPSSHFVEVFFFQVSLQRWLYAVMNAWIEWYLRDVSSIRWIDLYLHLFHTFSAKHSVWITTVPHGQPIWSTLHCNGMAPSSHIYPNCCIKRRGHHFMESRKNERWSFHSRGK